MRTRAAVLAVAACALLAPGAGCHTQIVTNEPNAVIFVDGERVGQGTAEVRRMGLPGSVQVRVEVDGQVQGEQTLKRSFTMATALLGLCTYGTGWFWAWQYPEELYISVEPSAARDPWGAEADPWLTPRR